MNDFYLRFSPIKQPKYTNFFIYKGLSLNGFEYKCFSDKGKFVARMLAYPEFYLQEFKNMYYIDSLIVNNRCKNIGRKLLNIAEKDSYLAGCGGRLHLISSDCYFPSNPPHIFYRKNGFESTEDSIN